MNNSHGLGISLYWGDLVFSVTAIFKWQWKLEVASGQLLNPYVPGSFSFIKAPIYISAASGAKTTSLVWSAGQELCGGAQERTRQTWMPRSLTLLSPFFFPIIDLSYLIGVSSGQDNNKCEKTDRLFHPPILHLNQPLVLQLALKTPHKQK